MSQRVIRAQELIKRELSNIIAKENNFADAFVTINRVSLTPDLKKSHVFISTILANSSTPKQKQEFNEIIIKKLQRDRHNLQKKISQRVSLKFTPILIFKLDDSFEKNENLFSILDELDSKTDVSQNNPVKKKKSDNLQDLDILEE